MSTENIGAQLLFFDRERLFKVLVWIMICVMVEDKFEEPKFDNQKLFTEFLSFHFIIDDD